MPTQKKFLDEAGLIQLLLEIESLDKTNLKDVYWSTDNADVNPTIIFKQGDDNGAAHSIHKVTFAGNTSNDTETALTGTKYEVHYITITIGGVSKTIPYLVTTRLPSTAVTHSHQNDTSDPATASTVSAALNRLTTKLAALEVIGGEPNVLSDWNQTTTTADDYIKNKPTFKTVNNASIIGTGDISVQAPLTFDNSPTANSSNPVKSSGVKTAVDDAAKTVKLTTKSDDKSYNVLITDIANSGTNDEIEFTELIVHNPYTRETVFHTTVDETSVNVTIANGGISFGNNKKIDASSYSGRASGTEEYLENDEQLTDGASKIGFYDEVNETSTTVAAAINDLYQTIGGTGNDDESLITKVTALETGKADKSAAVGNITGTTGGNETANYTMVNGTSGTFVYKNDKVAYTNDTTTSGNLPVVLGNGVTPTTPGGVKYNNTVTFNPTAKTLYVQDGNTLMSIAPSTLNAVSGTGSSRKEIAVGSTGIIFLTTSGNLVGNISNNGTAVTFTGTSAKSISDGNGNNIVSTYATKTELAAIKSGQFKVASTAEATAIAQGNATNLELGYIYLVEDTSASSPNIFNEYVKVALGTDPETYAVEKIGTTDAGVDVVTIPATGTNSVHSYFAQYIINA